MCVFIYALNSFITYTLKKDFIWLVAKGMHNKAVTNRNKTNRYAHTKSVTERNL